jgi:hypothetical protein
LPTVPVFYCFNVFFLLNLSFFRFLSLCFFSITQAVEKELETALMRRLKVTHASSTAPPPTSAGLLQVPHATASARNAHANNNKNSNGVSSNTLPTQPPNGPISGGISVSEEGVQTLVTAALEAE